MHITCTDPQRSQSFRFCHFYCFYPPISYICCPELIWFDWSHSILPPETQASSNSFQQIPTCCCFIVDSSPLGVFVLGVSVFSILSPVSVAPQRLTSAVTFKRSSDRKQGRLPLSVSWHSSDAVTTPLIDVCNRICCVEWAFCHLWMWLKPTEETRRSKQSVTHTEGGEKKWISKVVS